ncbi:MAG: enolase C-terminal domain-like protein [Desulfobacterales bacterium]|nr:enolase C-terminal domain-like protein [Desulfobacterales bacterium]
MQIDKVNIYQVLLPFTSDFAHSLRKRSSAKNIVTEVTAKNGEIKGYGESAPRSYVTGESQESVTSTIKGFIEQNNFPWELNDISQIWEFVDSLPGDKAHHCAICSIETALLDALGKNQNKYIIDYFPKDFRTDKIYYGALIPMDNKERIMEICGLIKKMKIKVNKLRIKIGKDFNQNKEIFDTVKDMFIDSYDLRVDINGAGDREPALKQLQLMKKYKVSIIEQPMMPDDPNIADYAKLAQTYGMILMADESACSLRDVKRLYKEGFYKMINVRLSKCGGFRNSLKIINYLRLNKTPFQIGCHLGESGILSAAGRILSLLCGDAVYYDGSYDKFLLKKNITCEDVSFGFGGEAGPLDGHGLGIKINKQNLLVLSDSSKTVTIMRP